MMTETTVAKAQMLIRKPVAQVFEALVEPAITSRFWFSKSSGRLEGAWQADPMGLGNVWPSHRSRGEGDRQE